ncbi:MAG TPA: hypothetical protein VGO93_01465 [Candidatus Xenobia bacterium]|jgi:peroxiredoxin Q/BCP
MKKLLMTFMALLTLSVCGQDALAPDVALPGTDGKTHTMRENIGKSWTVVAWYPKAFTSG